MVGSVTEARAHSLAHSSLLPPGREGDAELTTTAAGAADGAGAEEDRSTGVRVGARVFRPHGLGSGMFR